MNKNRLGILRIGRDWIFPLRCFKNPPNIKNKKLDDRETKLKGTLGKGIRLYRDRNLPINYGKN